MAGPAAGTNPINVVDDNPMGARQWIVVVLMIFLNALDGFDVLSSAFASPGITKEWGIERAQLGIVPRPSWLEWVSARSFSAASPTRSGASWISCCAWW
jgi:hypothetical protein